MTATGPTVGESSEGAILARILDRLFDGVSRNVPGYTASTMPSMDISETDKASEITAELPGLEKKDVELNVTDNLLTIRGEKKNEREDKTKDYHLVERSYGSFLRTVELPAGVNPDQIKAEMAKGVLKIAVTKPAPAQTRKIDVKAAA